MVDLALRKGISPGWMKEIRWISVKARKIDGQKITLGGHLYLGSFLVPWYNKKQASVSLSTIEVEYIVVGSFFVQLLWMKQVIEDFGVEMLVGTAYYDNTSTINILQNPMMHS
ncbi:hypothetical protein J1N35_029311 [Gossypium stocksii]|uniref:Uncharacterized protein n=1 Tax=Gossypium stocksii TaxID=47602 RepID=A0A9D3UZU5_9ROSI|nr:hypothetical protein J1N35_029311 [Gossypium stocksii]